MLFLWQQNADLSPARSALKSFKKETKCEFTDGCGILLLSVSNTKRAAFRIVNVAGVSCSWSWLGGPRSPITYKCKHEWSRGEDEDPVKTLSQSQVGGVRVLVSDWLFVSPMRKTASTGAPRILCVKYWESLFCFLLLLSLLQHSEKSFQSQYIIEDFR